MITLPNEFIKWHSRQYHYVTLSSYKHAHFILALCVDIHPWFGPHITKLHKGLHGFFAKRAHALAAALFIDRPLDSDDDSQWETWEPPPLPPPDPVADYQEFLGHFRTALSALQAESEQSLPVSSIGPVASTSQAADHQEQPEAYVGASKKRQPEGTEGHSGAGPDRSKRRKSDGDHTERPRRSKRNKPVR
jgi:hypothetical protein